MTNSMTTPTTATMSLSSPPPFEEQPPTEDPVEEPVEPAVAEGTCEPAEPSIDSPPPAEAAPTPVPPPPEAAPPPEPAASEPPARSRPTNCRRWGVGPPCDADHRARCAEQRMVGWRD